MEEGFLLANRITVRMLVVNATVAIQKWKERLDKLEEMKATNPNATL